VIHWEPFFLENRRLCAELCADLTRDQLQGGGVAISTQRFQDPVPAQKDAPSTERATAQRCLSKPSQHWDDEQLEAVVKVFKGNGLL
tara:strand:- start:2208 stop:2468 length:261 start_codon:yes stop_codon:yes gene_type:complete